MVLVGDYFEKFFHGLFLDFEYFGAETLAKWEGFGFGLYFGGVEVWIMRRGYLEDIRRGGVYWCCQWAVSRRRRGMREVGDRPWECGIVKGV